MEKSIICSSTELLLRTKSTKYGIKRNVWTVVILFHVHFRVLFCLGPPSMMTLKQNAEDAVHSTFQWVPRLCLLYFTSSSPSQQCLQFILLLLTFPTPPSLSSYVPFSSLAFFSVQSSLLWFWGLPATKALSHYGAKLLRCKL